MEDYLLNVTSSAQGNLPTAATLKILLGEAEKLVVKIDPRVAKLIRAIQAQDKILVATS